MPRVGGGLLRTATLAGVLGGDPLPGAAVFLLFLLPRLPRLLFLCAPGPSDVKDSHELDAELVRPIEACTISFQSIPSGRAWPICFSRALLNCPGDNVGDLFDADCAAVSDVDFLGVDVSLGCRLTPLGPGVGEAPGSGGSCVVALPLVPPGSEPPLVPGSSCPRAGVAAVLFFFPFLVMSPKFYRVSRPCPSPGSAQPFPKRSHRTWVRAPGKSLSGDLGRV